MHTGLNGEIDREISRCCPLSERNYSLFCVLALISELLIREKIARIFYRNIFHLELMITLDLDVLKVCCGILIVFF